MPLYGLSRMKEVIAQAFPELAEFGFTDSRVSATLETVDRIKADVANLAMLVH